MKAKLVSYDKCKSIKVDLDTTRSYTNGSWNFCIVTRYQEM